MFFGAKQVCCTTGGDLDTLSFKTLAMFVFYLFIYFFPCVQRASSVIFAEGRYGCGLTRYTENLPVGPAINSCTFFFPG